MSWNLNVSGHINTGDLEQDRQVEAAVLDEVKRLVASLPVEAGVSYGTWSGQHTSGVQLARPAERPPATHEEVAMVEGFRGGRARARHRLISPTEKSLSESSASTTVVGKRATAQVRRLCRR